MKKTGKKGTTIAELCVVLALVTIIGAMVVSFSVMMSQRTRLSAARLDVMNDIELVESITETWLGQMRLQGATLSVEEKTAYTEVCATVGTQPNEIIYTLSFDMDKGVLKGTLPDGGEMTFALSRVQGVEFDTKILDGADLLLFYTVVYDLSGMGGTKNQQTQIFCANPHVGDTYGSWGGA